MATYLLTWNPEKWNWVTLAEDIQIIQQQGYFVDSWSCGVTKKITVGDRVFLMKLGSQKPQGLVASGWVASSVYQQPHWAKNQVNSKTAFYVDVHFDTILNPQTEIFPHIWLKDSIYASMNWTPQASGTQIPDEVAEKLESDWAKFLNYPVPLPQLLLPEEEPKESYFEGTAKQITVTTYERNLQARIICINRYGLNCVICGFNFEQMYGEIGQGFVHVHHLKPLSEIGEKYKLNPIQDLRPVCPNCHAMLHRRKPAYSIEELKERLNR